MKANCERTCEVCKPSKHNGLQVYKQVYKHYPSTNACHFYNNVFCIAVNCTWDEFSDWTTCTKTCGGGLQVRQRKVAVESQFGGAACVGGTAEQKICNTQNCPRKYNY